MGFNYPHTLSSSPQALRVVIRAVTPSSILQTLRVPSSAFDFLNTATPHWSIPTGRLPASSIVRALGYFCFCYSMSRYSRTSRANSKWTAVMATKAAQSFHHPSASRSGS